MTETTKEVLEKYQVRKSKKQKTAFIDYVEQVAENYAETRGIAGQGIRFQR